MDVPEDLVADYRAAVSRINAVLTDLISRGNLVDDRAVVEAYRSSLEAFSAQSDRLAGYLIEQRFPTGAPGQDANARDAENALAYAALVDGLVGLRSLLAVPDDQSSLRPLGGVSADQLRRRLGSALDPRVLTNLEAVRANGVSDDLITAALTGEASTAMPESALLPAIPDVHETSRLGDVFLRALDLRLEPAAEKLVSATTDLTVDLLLGWLVKGVGVFRVSEHERLFEALREIDTHYVRVELRIGACTCLRVLMRKMGAAAVELADQVRVALLGLEDFLIVTVRAMLENLLGAKTTFGQTRVKLHARNQPLPRFEVLSEEVISKDETKWKVAFGLADHAFPLAAASANLIGLGGVPILGILIVALLLVELALLERTVSEIV
jgi:hypothetical protein